MCAKEMIKTTHYSGGRVRYNPPAGYGWEDTSNSHWTEHCPHRITGNGFFQFKRTSAVRDEKQYNLSMADAVAYTGIDGVSLRKLMNKIIGKAQYNITKKLLIKAIEISQADKAGQPKSFELVPLPERPFPKMPGNGL